MRVDRLVQVAAVVAALAVVWGCGKTTEPGGVPSTRPAVFPAFALADSNRNAPTYGQPVRENHLAGRAAVVYFGWAT